MTPEELHKLETRYQRSSAKADRDREDRNAGIREALAEGWTHAKVAKATGLTRGRIGQLADFAPPRALARDFPQ